MLLLALRASRQFQRDGIHAVAQAGRSRTIPEDMTQVSVTAAAEDFRSPHEPAAVGAKRDVVLVDRLEEARPAGAGIELRLAIGQRLIAANTVIDAVFHRV